MERRLHHSQRRQRGQMRSVRWQQDGAGV